MTRDRDIERVLEHWLTDGVNEMPDRVYQSIFDRVERQPQALAPRLTRRLPAMNGSLRWIAAAAAVVLIAVVGFAVFGRTSVPGIGSPASPSPSPTASRLPAGNPGELVPGDNAAFYFDPLGTGRTQTMSFTVPAGWVESFDGGIEYRLRRAVDGPDTTNLVLMRPDVVLHSQADGCPEAALEGVERTPAAMADWLTSHQGLDVTTPQPVTIGGYDGLVLDIARRSTWTRTCPYSNGVPAVPLFSDLDPAEGGFDWGIGGDGRMRVYLVDLGAGRLLWAAVEVEDQATFDTVAPAASAIIESIRFEPSTP